MDEHFLITQSNSLIEARHIKPLSITEQKIILAMVSMIQPSDEDFRSYEIQIAEFRELCGLKSEGIYSEMKRTVRTLMEKIIEIPHQDGKGWVMTHWISSAEYVSGDGKIRLNFDPRLKPYLLQLKNAFTSYRLSNILSLKRVYSIRLYELTKKWQHVSKWTVSVDDLRPKLGVAEGKLELYGHFKSRALKPAVKEVNEKTDLFLSFKEIKKGRKVEKIEFTISKRQEKEITIPPLSLKEIDSEQIRMTMNQKAFGFTFDPVTFRDIYAKAFSMWREESENQLSALVLHVNGAVRIENKIGYFRSLINDGHQHVLNGGSFSADDFSSRRECLPSWFTQPGEREEDVLDDSFEEEKRKLEQELRSRSETIRS